MLKSFPFLVAGYFELFCQQVFPFVVARFPFLLARPSRLCQRSRAERVGGFGLREWLGKARPAVERRDSFAQRRKTKGMH